MPAVDRLGIQSDTYALAKGGYLPATQFLAVAEAYKNETDASVCADLAANLRALDALLGNEPSYPDFQSMARSIFQPIVGRVGWDARPGEGHLDALLRSTAIDQLGSYEDDNTLSEATSRFALYVDDRSNIHPDIRGVVVALAAKRGDRSTYDTMWDLQQKADLPEEQVRFLLALGRFEHPDFLHETLQRSLSTDVRVHDTINVLAAVAGNRRGRDMAWEFIKGNWDELFRRYGEGGFGIMRLVSLTSGFTTLEKREDVKRFFDEHPTPAAERTVRQSLERIRLNVSWLERNREELAEWFANRR